MPGSATTSSPGPSTSDGTRVARSTSCRSTSADTTAVSWSWRIPAGVRTTVCWENRRIGPPRPASQRMIGVAGIRPVPARSSVLAPPGWAAVATSARPATVGWSNTSRGRSRRPAALARLTSWMDTMLSPPRAKKSSSGPTRSRPSSSANTWASTASAPARGGRVCCWRGAAGAGSALRSSLPLGVSGNAASTTISAGTRWSGRVVARAARSSAGSQSRSGLGVT